MITQIQYRDLAVSRLRQQYKESNLIHVYEPTGEQSQELEKVFDDILTSRIIDEADGVQLDIIGEIVGQPRAIVDSSSIGFFGFFDFPGAEPFGDTDPDSTVGGRLRSRLESSTEVRVLNDREYRTFIRAKIKSNQTNCTPDQIAEIVQFIFGTTFTYIQENPNGDAAKFQVIINKELSTADNLLLGTGIVPKPAGVTVEYRGSSIVDPDNPLIYSAQYTIARLLANNYSDGDLIDKFTDSALSGNDAIQPDPAKQPTFRSRAFPVYADPDELPIIPFDEVNYGNILNGGYTIAVAEPTAPDILSMGRTEPNIDFLSPVIQDDDFYGFYFQLELDTWNYATTDPDKILGFTEDIITGDTNSLLFALTAGIFIARQQVDGQNVGNNFAIGFHLFDPVTMDLSGGCGQVYEIRPTTVLYLGMNRLGQMYFHHSEAGGQVLENPGVAARIADIKQMLFGKDFAAPTPPGSDQMTNEVNLIENPAIEFPGAKQLKTNMTGSTPSGGFPLLDSRIEFSGPGNPYYADIGPNGLSALIPDATPNFTSYLPGDPDFPGWSNPVAGITVTNPGLLTFNQPGPIAGGNTFADLIFNPQIQANQDITVIARLIFSECYISHTPTGAINVEDLDTNISRGASLSGNNIDELLYITITNPNSMTSDAGPLNLRDMFGDVVSLAGNIGTLEILRIDVYDSVANPQANILVTSGYPSPVDFTGVKYGVYFSYDDIVAANQSVYSGPGFTYAKTGNPVPTFAIVGVLVFDVISKSLTSLNMGDIFGGDAAFLDNLNHPWSPGDVYCFAVDENGLCEFYLPGGASNKPADYTFQLTTNVASKMSAIETFTLGVVPNAPYACGDFAMNIEENPALEFDGVTNILTLPASGGGGQQVLQSSNEIGRAHV